MTAETLGAALLFVAIFLLGSRFTATRSPRAALSLGAGVATAYVFVHMLPEMDEAGRVFVAETAHQDLPLPELRVYSSALAGFVLFYGLEHLVAWSREQAPRDAADEGREGAMSPIFFMHVGGFAAYVWLVCYLMVRGITETPVPVAMYAAAMGLHFLGVDHSLIREHGAAYHRAGKYILAAAALAGWACAALPAISKPILITGLGLVSGGVVMNSMIMELPRDKDGRFVPFLIGAAAYAVVLALVR